MVRLVLIFVLQVFRCAFVTGQSGVSTQETTIKHRADSTHVSTTQDGRLVLMISDHDDQRIKASGLVTYEDFGALGDGETDDMAAIVAAHAYANFHDFKVKARNGATYYLGGKALTAVIQTDVDFGKASFIIDDTDAEDRTKYVFLVRSNLEADTLVGVESLARDQAQIKASLPGRCLITVTNDQVRRYIRYGANRNKGSFQTDIFLVEPDGRVNGDTPIVWDFEQVSEISALPIDSDTLLIQGGRFTTIANQEDSQYNYFRRGLAIHRSNVVVEGLEHHIVGELDHGAPYHGFLIIRDCAFVTVRNCLLTGHKTYRTIGRAGVPVSMGSYDISINRALYVSFIDCRQTNDIDDRTYWGIMGSNFCKNLLFDGCHFSRFDAHQGVANAIIRNSTLGHMGINAIGTGTFTVENSTIRGKSIINLRQDYGSTWEGEIHIRDCTFVPVGGQPVSSSLIRGFNSGQHDFGYTCFMPQKIIIENLVIDDSNHPDDYQGPAIFADFNPKRKDHSYQEAHPYVITEEVHLRNVQILSGRKLRLSDNPVMFREVQISRF